MLNIKLLRYKTPLSKKWVMLFDTIFSCEIDIYLVAVESKQNLTNNNNNNKQKPQITSMTGQSCQFMLDDNVSYSVIIYLM